MKYSKLCQDCYALVVHDSEFGYICENCGRVGCEFIEGIEENEFIFGSFNNPEGVTKKILNLESIFSRDEILCCEDNVVSIEKLAMFSHFRLQRLTEICRYISKEDIEKFLILTICRMNSHGYHKRFANYNNSIDLKSEEDEM